MKQINSQIASIEAEARLEADPGLPRRFAILTSIPGIARLTAFDLLVELPELGTLEAIQAASLAGLAPVGRALIPFLVDEFVGADPRHHRPQPRADFLDRMRGRLRPHRLERGLVDLVLEHPIAGEPPRLDVA